MLDLKGMIFTELQHCGSDIILSSSSLASNLLLRNISLEYFRYPLRFYLEVSSRFLLWCTDTAPSSGAPDELYTRPRQLSSKQYIRRWTLGTDYIGWMFSASAVHWEKRMAFCNPRSSKRSFFQASVPARSTISSTISRRRSYKMQAESVSASTSSSRCSSDSHRRHVKYHLVCRSTDAPDPDEHESALLWILFPWCSTRRSCRRVIFSP